MVIDPGNNVNSTSNSPAKTRQGQVRNADVAENNKANNPAKDSGDNVSLSNTAQSLSRLEAAVANVPEVNAERVAEIKAAVDSDQYQVDSYALAGKMLAQDDL